MTGNAEGRPAPACTAGVPRLVTRHRAKAEGRGQCTWPQDAQDETWARSPGKSRTEERRPQGPSRAGGGVWPGRRPGVRNPPRPRLPAKLSTGPAMRPAPPLSSETKGRVGAPRGGGGGAGRDGAREQPAWRVTLLAEKTGRTLGGLRGIESPGKLPGVFSRMSLDYPGRPAQNRTDMPHPGTQMTDSVTFT